MLRPPPTSTLFPYTTLFRSSRSSAVARGGNRPLPARDAAAARISRVRRARDPDRLCGRDGPRSEEHTSELQSLRHLVCRLLLEKKKKINAETTLYTNHYIVS